MAEVSLAFAAALLILDGEGAGSHLQIGGEWKRGGGGGGRERRFSGSVESSPPMSDASRPSLSSGGAKLEMTKSSSIKVSGAAQQHVVPSCSMRRART